MAPFLTKRTSAEIKCLEWEIILGHPARSSFITSILIRWQGQAEKRSVKRDREIAQSASVSCAITKIQVLFPATT